MLLRRSGVNGTRSRSSCVAAGWSLAQPGYSEGCVPATRFIVGTPAARARPTVLQAMKKQSSSLISVLKDELKYERESYRKDEALLHPPPNDFDLREMPGRSSFFLVKQYKSETVLVTCNIESQQDPEDEDEEGEEDEPIADSEDMPQLPPVEFQVSIRKGDDKTLTFDCIGSAEFFSIEHLAYSSDDSVDENGDPLGDDAYLGPVFDELDDTLQQAFIYYLKERGINTELSEYIQLLAIDKTSLEYQTWLEKVKDFVAL